MPPAEAAGAARRGDQRRDGGGDAAHTHAGGAAGGAAGAAASGGAAAGGMTPAELLVKWLFPMLLLLLGLRVFYMVIQPQADQFLTSRRAGAPARTPDYYYYNEATGQVQWEDPGDVPHEEPDGTRHWVTPDGVKTPADPSAGKYAWVEQYSAELVRPYFFNLETSESTWERPADLSWRRIKVEDPE